nr:sec-independent protein translocase protein TATC, chloroplastic [Ipomoea batatas]
MGSSSAIIPNLNLNNPRCFKCLNSKLSNQRANLKLFQRKPRLAFPSRRRFSRLLCSAVEDATEKQQASGGSGLSSAVEDRIDAPKENVFQNDESDLEGSAIYNLLYPSKELLPDDKEMSIFDHLEELRERLIVSVLAVGGAMAGCFAISKELILFLEAPVSAQGVRFLQLGPGEFFFTTLKVSGYCGLLLGSPVILYEIIAFVLPGLTKAERRFLAPIVLGSSVLFYAGIVFSYYVLTPAALNFFVNYAEGAVESLWSIDQYFEFVLVLMFSTGLSFQVPVVQLLLGQTGLVSGDQMLSIWRYVVVGAVVAAAVLTPSTDPLTQVLLAGPLLGLYLGGAWVVKLSGK